MQSRVVLPFSLALLYLSGEITSLEIGLLLVLNNLLLHVLQRSFIFLSQLVLNAWPMNT